MTPRLRCGVLTAGYRKAHVDAPCARPAIRRHSRAWRYLKRAPNIQGTATYHAPNTLRSLSACPQSCELEAGMVNVERRRRDHLSRDVRPTASLMSAARECAGSAGRCPHNVLHRRQLILRLCTAVLVHSTTPPPPRNTATQTGDNSQGGHQQLKRTLLPLTLSHGTRLRRLLFGANLRENQESLNALSIKRRL